MLSRHFFSIYMPSKYFLHNTASIRKYLLPHDLGLCATMAIGKSSHAPLLSPKLQPPSDPAGHRAILVTSKVQTRRYRTSQLQRTQCSLLIFHNGHCQNKVSVTSQFCSPQNTGFRSNGERYFVKSAHSSSFPPRMRYPEAESQETFIKFMFYCPLFLYQLCFIFFLFSSTLDEVYLTSVNSYHDTEVSRCLGLVFKHLIKGKCWSSFSLLWLTNSVSGAMDFHKLSFSLGLQIFLFEVRVINSNHSSNPNSSSIK